MTDFGKTWDTLHKEHGRSAIDGGSSQGNDTVYLLHGEMLAKRIHEFAGAACTKDVLEYGCGDGRVAKAMMTTCKSLSVVDASPMILEKAKQRLGATVPAFQANWPSELPADQTWDVVYSTAVIYHLTDIQTYRLLAEMLPRLRVGGVYVFDICNLFHPDYVNLLQQKSKGGDWTIPWPWVPQSATNITHIAQNVLKYRAVTRFDADTQHPWLLCWK